MNSQGNRMASPAEPTGPLKGMRIVEFAGVGPGPFCGMLLADLGADVISVDRVEPHGLGIKKETRFNPINRNRPSMAVDLKSEAGRKVALRLIASADALVEGFRPGVMERLGLSPQACWEVNPRLVFGRMTGWGQEGPLADTVGHDLNYLALSGVLPFLGARDRKPAIPLNLLGDFAGGGLYLALGIVSAVLEARTSGQGQVVDAAMLDGIASLMTHQFGYAGSGQWIEERESNVIDGGAPWYHIYETKDGKYISVAAVEPKFYRQLLEGMGLDPATVPPAMDKGSWPQTCERFAAVFASRTRDEWCAAMEGREACFAPVLDVHEAVRHPHAVARKSYMELEGVIQPIPAPRFSRTPPNVRRPVPVPGAHTVEVMAAWGFSEAEIADLRSRNVVSQA